MLHFILNKFYKILVLLNIKNAILFISRKI